MRADGERTARGIRGDREGALPVGNRFFPEALDGLNRRFRCRAEGQQSESD